MTNGGDIVIGYIKYNSQSLCYMDFDAVTAVMFFLFKRFTYYF